MLGALGAILLQSTTVLQIFIESQSIIVYMMHQVLHTVALGGPNQSSSGAGCWWFSDGSGVF